MSFTPAQVTYMENQHPGLRESDPALFWALLGLQRWDARLPEFLRPERELMLTFTQARTANRRIAHERSKRGIDV